VHRVGNKTHTGNGRNSQKGSDPPSDCTSS
jgi:hypothetical protein